MKLLAMIHEKQAVVGAFLKNPWSVYFFKRKDPERVKAYSRVASWLGNLALHLETADGGPGPVHALGSILDRINPRLSREECWNIAEDLRVAALYWAPDVQLESLLAAEASERPSHPSLRWQHAFPPEELTSLLAQAGGDARPPGWRTTALDRLKTLYELRIDSWRHDRAILQLRSNYFVAVTLLLGAVLAVTAGLAFWAEGGLAEKNSKLLWIAMSAGALGSVLSGIFKLRDQQMGIRELRSFWSILNVQPVVGATAALLLFVALGSNFIQIAGLQVNALSWQHHALFGFAAGFSEPFFLGLVSRLTGSDTKDSGRSSIGPEAPSEPAVPVAASSADARRSGTNRT